MCQPCPESASQFVAYAVSRSDRSGEREAGSDDQFGGDGGAGGVGGVMNPPAPIGSSSSTLGDCARVGAETSW